MLNTAVAEGSANRRSIKWVSKLSVRSVPMLSTIVSPSGNERMRHNQAKCRSLLHDFLALKEYEGIASTYSRFVNNSMTQTPS